MKALELQLVPGPAVGGERVTTSTRVGSPTPARLDALSLTGPGCDGVTAALHPLIRRWSARQTVTVTYIAELGEIRTEDREVTTWFQELACDASGQVIQVPHDDQIGALPPAQWLESWVRMWREHFGHHQPLPVHLDRRADTGVPDADARTERIKRLLSLGAALQPAARPMDPLKDEWEIRFGEPAAGEAPSANVSYLLLWLDGACDAGDVLDIGSLAGELRALNAELTRVLGEKPDQQWLGRCPASLNDVVAVDGGDPELTEVRSRPCGAGLWQDPHASQVQCSRCHATWGPRKTELLYLAMEIRRVWPVDRRRRYHRGEIDTLRPLRCPGCAQTAAVQWRDVTATGDDRRWWRPEKVTCPNGCPQSSRLM